jgi:hypothetical protein
MLSFKSITNYFATAFTFSFDGGVGEAALYGALIGGGKNLISGDNILTGALTGAVLGGATGAIVGPGAEVADTGVGLGTEAAKQAAIDAQVASSQAMLSPTIAPIGGANLTTAGGQGILSSAASQGLPSAVTQGVYPNFTNQAMASAVPQAASNVVLPGAQQGIASVAQKPGLMDQAKGWYGGLSTMEKAGVGLGGAALLSSMTAQPTVDSLDDSYDGPLKKFKYDPKNFTPSRITPNVYQSHYAIGGIAGASNNGYPMGRQDPTQYATPSQMPMSAEVINAGYEPIGMANGGMAQGGLGGYSAGGNARLLKGPGDGMSDDIPATIANRQPARLADGEFVVPADVVSHLGNGSTDAGAKHLHSMMDKVRKARTGRKAQGKQIKPEKFLPK